MEALLKLIADRDTPASLRLKAAEIMELASKARTVAVARELETLAMRYLRRADELEGGAASQVA
jgi:hypothetical protein